MTVIAHAGHIWATLPFFAPAFVLPLTLAVIVARDRPRTREELD